MAYFLVMGSLALSVVFSLGWVLVRGGQWLSGRVVGSGKAKRTRRPARRTPVKKKPGRTPSPRARGGAKSRSTARPKARGEPWALTRWLAARRFALPLSLLAALLYGFTRLAAYGMAARPQDAPGAFHDLVAFLGWATAVLVGLAVIQLMASWRCR